MAIVAVPLFLFIFTSIEFGRAMMAVHSLEEAARIGCRSAILNGATVTSVENRLDEVMSAAGIAQHTVVVNPTQLSAAEQWDPISVQVTASLGDISWLPLPQFVQGVEFTGSCTLPRESSEGG